MDKEEQKAFDELMEQRKGDEGFLTGKELEREALKLFDENKERIESFLSKKDKLPVKKIAIGAKLREIKTGIIYEIVTLQGYMNYDVGIERFGDINPDTEYIRRQAIGTDYELIGG